MKVNKMKAYNVILVYSPDMSRILMVKRAKEPYKGLYNCPGGKLEAGESNLEGAYRELFEETGISQKDIELKPIAVTQYLLSNIELQFFAGRLFHEVTLTEEVNRLEWLSADEDLFDMTRFAGEGNLGHFAAQVRLHLNELFPNT